MKKKSKEAIPGHKNVRNEICAKFGSFHSFFFELWSKKGEFWGVFGQILDQKKVSKIFFSRPF